ncbi:hypothetical protein [Labilibacter marinus]|uniref:hypothetical protein n=1 Tax=Labilibacter marinus TaxID=1477105 RepID=UPI0009501DD0|nr:hypothetical protein [Labilibacter marinus]
MRKVTLVALIAILMSSVNAQKLVQLHPMVGDTIDATEKMVFYLFPEITDSIFEQGIIYRQNSDYNVNIKLVGQETYKVGIDSTVLNEYQQNIEKLAMYYSNLAEPDTTNLSDLNSVRLSAKLNPEFNLTAEQRKKLVKDSRRYWRKKDKAEDIGLWGVDKENYIKSSSHTNIFKGKVRF